jgi:hypothetical protein
MSELEQTLRTAPEPEALPPPAKRSKEKKKSTRGYWVRQLHTWHWISSAISLVGLLLFTLTGYTLNHAGEIEATPQVVQASAELDEAGIAALEPFTDGQKAALPAEVRQQADKLLDTTVPASPAEWSDLEVYLAMPQPGGDAWLSIDRENGTMTYESTNRGWIAYFNDLHKGRNTGEVWRGFIDVFVFASVVFIVTGFILMFMHSRNRPLTWPVTGLGLIIPVMLAILFIH